MLDLLAFLLMLLAQQAAVISPPPYVETAAAIAAGEAPMSLVGVDGYAGVLCTMRNRLDSPHFPNDWPGVLAAYYAPPRTPTERELRIAGDILTQPAACPWAGYYALSQQDVDRRGYPDGDYISAATILPSGRVIRVHFYAQFPDSDTDYHRCTQIFRPK